MFAHRTTSTSSITLISLNLFLSLLNTITHSGLVDFIVIFNASLLFYVSIRYFNTSFISITRYTWMLPLPAPRLIYLSKINLNSNSLELDLLKLATI